MINRNSDLLYHINCILCILLFCPNYCFGKRTVHKQKGLLLLSDKIYERNGLSGVIQVNKDTLMPDVFLKADIDIENPDSVKVINALYEYSKKKNSDGHVVYLYGNCECDQKLRDSYIKRSFSFQVNTDSSKGYYSGVINILPVEIEFVTYDAQITAYYLRHNDVVLDIRRAPIAIKISRLGYAVLQAK